MNASVAAHAAALAMAALVGLSACSTSETDPNQPSEAQVGDEPTLVADDEPSEVVDESASLVPEESDPAQNSVNLDVETVALALAGFEASTGRYPKTIDEVRSLPDVALGRGNRISAFRSDGRAFLLCVANKDAHAAWDSSVGGLVDDPCLPGPY